MVMKLEGNGAGSGFQWPSFSWSCKDQVVTVFSRNSTSKLAWSDGIEGKHRAVMERTRKT
jgi:hypothetical protein